MLIYKIIYLKIKLKIFFWKIICYELFIVNNNFPEKYFYFYFIKIFQLVPAPDSLKKNTIYLFETIVS